MSAASEHGAYATTIGEEIERAIGYHLRIANDRFDALTPDRLLGLVYFDQIMADLDAAGVPR